MFFFHVLGETRFGIIMFGVRYRLVLFRQKILVPSQVQVGVVFFLKLEP